MKTVKAVKMTPEQVDRYKLMRDAMLIAEIAYSASGEHYAKMVKRFWEELHEVFDLPKESMPTVNWTNGDITFLEQT